MGKDFNVTFSCSGQESEWFASYHELIISLNVCMFRANEYIIGSFPDQFTLFLYSKVLLHLGDAPVLHVSSEVV